MTADRNARERRTLVVGVAAIAAIVLVGRGVPAALAGVRDASASAREVLGEYDRARGELRALPAVRDSARARRLRLGQEIGSLLRGRGSGGLVAALVGELNADADASRIAVSGIDGRVDTLAAGSYVPVTARVDALGDVRSLASFVAMIESSEVRLRVVELSVNQSEPSAPPQQPEALHATLVVQGLARRPAGQLQRAVADTSRRGSGEKHAP